MGNFPDGLFSIHRDHGMPKHEIANFSHKEYTVVVMGRLDQRSINRRRYGTIAFGH